MRRLYYINRHSYNLFHSPSIENGVVTIKTFDNKSITITEKSYVEDFVPIAPFWRHLKSEEVAIYEDTKSESDIVLRYADDAHDNKYHVTPKELMTEWQSFKHNPKKEGTHMQPTESPFAMDEEHTNRGDVYWPRNNQKQSMEFPTQITILNNIIDIKWMDKAEEIDHSKFGYFAAHSQLIKIARDQKPRKIAETFMHEITHAIHWAFALGDNDKEERFTDLTSTGICLLWQQNPKEMEWWKRMNDGQLSSL